MRNTRTKPEIVFVMNIDFPKFKFSHTWYFKPCALKRFHELVEDHGMEIIIDSSSESLVMMAQNTATNQSISIIETQLS